MPVFGLGTWRLADAECSEMVAAALELGYTQIDTADMYENHVAVGKGLQGFDRETYFLTSKVPPDKLRPEDVVATCERNLEELGVEYLDLYLIHWPNHDIPMEDTFAGFELLVQRGMVRSIGVSNFVVQRLHRAIGISAVPICINQVEYHPMLNQSKLHEFCMKNAIYLTAYCPLGRGEALRLAVIQKLAEHYGKTPAQICLRWLLQKSIVAIPKTSSRERLAENMRLFDWDLAAEDMQRIDDIPLNKRLINPDFSEF